MNTDFFRDSSGLTITGLAAGALKINGSAEFAEAMASVNGGLTLQRYGQRERRNHVDRALSFPLGYEPQS
jgi:hypothetical protein